MSSKPHPVRLRHPSHGDFEVELDRTYTLERHEHGEVVECRTGVSALEFIEHLKADGYVLLQKLFCPSTHAHTGEYCTREAGHEGYCHGKMKRWTDGSLNRTHWYSVNGKYKDHHWYEKLTAPNGRPLQ